jgi:hypothetical protein
MHIAQLMSIFATVNVRYGTVILLIQSLLSYLDSASCSPDIIFLQETWKIFDPTHFTLFNYSPLQFTCRENRQGLYFKNGLQFKIVQEKSIFLEFIIEPLLRRSPYLILKNLLLFLSTDLLLAIQLYLKRINLNNLWNYLLTLLAICKTAILIYIF